MAARDRYGGFSEPATTPLQRLIQNACDPQNYEPNLALDLEIADLINSKKGTAPREAAIAIVGHINNRNPNISMLALTLLDICVKNCGYPFHLQISTKEFLNELVRRFPERPPMRYSRNQSKILELIEEWRSTICQTSKYKEDLGFIRDMHRLLSYKGYTFPAVKREDAAVLNPSEALKSAEEMEEEEKEHQSAKLQELIRRGTPHDLQEANRLMKVMAGYDNRRKTDYRAKAAEEVGKIQQKARILEEMLESYRQDDKESAEGAEDLSNALASAQPKIQKMCEEESDDHEAVAKLFEINDSIHRTLERYKLIRSGNVEAAAQIPRGTLGTSGAGVSKGPGNELSLIDFGPANASSAPASGDLDAAGTAQPAASQGESSLENDLIGLSLGDNTQSAGGQISLGGPPQQQQGHAAGASSASSKQSIMNAFNTPPAYSQPSFAQQPFSPPSVQQPSLIGQQPPTMAAASPAPQQQQQPQNPPPQSRATPDPFASLSSISNNSTRTSSPFQFQQAARPPPSQPPPQNNAASLLQTSTPPPPQPAAKSNGNAPADDEWTFTSALPDQAHELTVTNSTLHINFLVSRPPSTPNEVLIKSSISNNTAHPVADLTFQAAVSKGVTLKMEPQSTRNMGPQQRAGISQTIRLFGVEHGKGKSVKVRWKVSYYLGAERREEMGELADLGVA